jgi:hypothetical protein
LAAAACLYALGRKPASRRILRLAAVQTIALIGIVGFFGFVALALTTNHVNPTLGLRFVPWACAVAGPVTLKVGLSARLPVASDGALLTDRKRLQPVARILGWLATLIFLCLFAIIAVRSFVIDNCWPYASAPYRFLELMLTDQVDAVATDECLVARVLEYGPTSLSVDVPAGQIRSRGPSAVPAVVAVMDRTRLDWPPPPHTVSKGGVRWALEFLLEKGEAGAAARWDGVDWERDIAEANSCWRLSPMEGGWLSP